MAQHLCTDAKGKSIWAEGRSENCKNADAHGGRLKKMNPVKGIR